MLRLLFLLVCCVSLGNAFELPRASTQCLVGVAKDWNNSYVTLQLYQKQGNAWVKSGASWNGRLGKNGLIWGLGIHSNPSKVAIKQEGDGRTPAGVFRIGGAWGNHATIRKNPLLPYRQVTPRDLWVEDPASPSYNKHVILNHDPVTPWEKKQQMKQDDPAHKLKLFIAHNAAPNIRKGAGSSIFFHIWRDGGGRATAGCTTMDEGKLRTLIAAIDPSKQPLYVILPQSEYTKYKQPWQLP
jgi:L,D-peptidoglycan transpeptidase YkuD (ErfK/YbiS/YcfS/YnhG family)